MNNQRKNICIMGLGYVGITLAVAFLLKGHKVTGVEIKESIRSSLKDGQLHIQEPGMETIIKESVDQKRFLIRSKLPDQVDTVFICVGTPFDKASGQPVLCYIEEALKMLNGKISEETLIIVRSTVPIGTTNKVYQLLKEYVDEPKVVFAPERTIQGKALKELLSLPQIIGTANAQHFKEAKEIFELLQVEILRVHSLEAAELIKLACNSHTDLIYSFGNELANIANCFDLDVYEVIEAANHHYPRPDICKPGYVGGSCLTKDPYHLIFAAQQNGYMPRLIHSARQLNEKMPEIILNQIERKLEKAWKDVTVIISGLAYKGVPETDDLRGSAVWDMIHLLKLRGVNSIRGHDFVLNKEKILEIGIEPISFEEGLLHSDVTIILNNHPKYLEVDIKETVSKMNKNFILYDLWGVWKERSESFTSTINYMGVGYNG
ncbi:nucleotide sugar dehydrogenase [Bacillus mojavensis]|uniref:nucleotide sugar dehydrogenase n=1 Tax=Bacillus mojavensis TaxID=72360 RepID=UPI002DB5C632|nr:nucleotide sugar dehydrogenase [Bacillus mojavensis]MEC1686909.1 nucleotide sugar dehydrogenase [Bacillus mojavensis]